MDVCAAIKSLTDDSIAAAWLGLNTSPYPIRHSVLATNLCAQPPPVMALHQVGLRPKRFAQGFLAPLEMTIGGCRVDSVAVVRAIEEAR